MTTNDTNTSDTDRWEPAFQCPSCGHEMRPRGRCKNQDCLNWEYTEIKRHETGCQYRFGGSNNE